jgi:hypothetical protein
LKSGRKFWPFYLRWQIIVKRITLPQREIISPWGGAMRDLVLYLEALGQQLAYDILDRHSDTRGVELHHA